MRPSRAFTDVDPNRPALPELCDLLDRLRSEVALLDAVGLHDVADRLAAYEKLVRRLVHAAITELCAPAA